MRLILIFARDLITNINSKQYSCKRFNMKLSVVFQPSLISLAIFATLNQASFAAPLDDDSNTNQTN